MLKKSYIIGSLVLTGLLAGLIIEGVVKYASHPTVKTTDASLTTQKVLLQSSVPLPKSVDINNKIHSNKIKDIASKSKNPQKDVNDYLNTLNMSDLLLSIAEVSDDIKDSGNISELAMFAPSAYQKLMGNLTNADCELIYTNPDYSVPFKLFIADMKSTEKYQKKIQNDKGYNKLLRDILQDETQKEPLRFTSLMNIDDYVAGDIPSLEKLTDSKNSSDIMKANALRILKRVDKDKGNIHVVKILQNVNQYSEPEVTVSLDTLGNLTDQTAIINGNEDEIDLINNAIKQTTNKHIIQSAVFALAHFKNEKSVATLLENRSKVNDDSVIRFYVDSNYAVVENMLSSKDDSVVNNALTCVEITPFKNFIPKITELKASATNNETKSRLGNLISLIKSSKLERNVKFDKQ
jgi:hypothetical protein